MLDNIYARRSVRNFTDKEVPEDVLRELIKAGTYAPTATNQQPWRFVVVTKKELIAKYSERARIGFVEHFKNNEALAGYVKVLSKPGYDMFYGAPVLILAFSAPNTVNDHDVALAAENMMLAGWSLGLGSCWIGLAGALGVDQEFLKEIGVPEGHKLVAPLIFGYPSKETRRAPARNSDVILSWL